MSGIFLTKVVYLNFLIIDNANLFWFVALGFLLGIQMLGFLDNLIGMQVLGFLDNLIGMQVLGFLDNLIGMQVLGFLDNLLGIQVLGFLDNWLGIQCLIFPTSGVRNKNSGGEICAGVSSFLVLLE
nr:hypothetical protein BaRGS_023290 [Batillaria attramentaria]